MKKNLLEEVKADYEMINDKEVTIEGYYVTKKLYELVPPKFRELIAIDEADNSLWFSYQRIGKLSNIESVEDRDMNGTTFDMILDIERIKGEPVHIQFNFGRNKDNDNKCEYLDYKIVVGY